MEHESNNEQTIHERIAAWNEQKRAEGAALAAMLDEEEAAQIAKIAAAQAELAETQRARATLRSAVMPATAVVPPAPVAPTTPDQPTSGRAAGRLFDSVTRAKLRVASLALIAQATLERENGLTFHELLARVQEIKPETTEGSLHSTLGRARDKSIRFHGRRGHMTYSVIRGARPGEPAGKASSAAPGEDSSDASRAERIVELLRGQPQMPIGDLAAIVLGASTKETRSQVRGTLNGLRVAGRAHNEAGRGKWEVTMAK